MSDEQTPQGPHQGQPVLGAGLALKDAKAAMIMVHGRGATAQNILMMSQEFNVPGFAYVAPQAAGYQWYPFSFLAPIEQNEPGLSSGLAQLGALMEHIAEAGIPPERTMLLGFSQGACLAVEFAARNTRRYGGIAVLSGGLIGPDGTPRDYPGDMAGTPVFLGCSDVDPHIPAERVKHTTEVMTRLGADVTERLYPGMAHTVNEDELTVVRQMMHEVAALAEE